VLGHHTPLVHRHHITGGVLQLVELLIDHLALLIVGDRVGRQNIRNDIVHHVQVVEDHGRTRMRRAEPRRDG
jgi:hypothetical protein